MRGVIEKTLRRHGYTVIAAADGPEAIAIAAECLRPIDALLTDVILPGASGREFARHVVATHPSVRALDMSGYTDDVIVQHGVLKPGLTFVQKPFTGDALARRIRDVLEAGSPPLL